MEVAVKVRFDIGLEVFKRDFRSLPKPGLISAFITMLSRESICLAISAAALLTFAALLRSIQTMTTLPLEDSTNFSNSVGLVEARVVAKILLPSHFSTNCLINSRPIPRLEPVMSQVDMFVLGALGMLNANLRREWIISHRIGGQPQMRQDTTF